MTFSDAISFITIGYSDAVVEDTIEPKFDDHVPATIFHPDFNPEDKEKLSKNLEVGLVLETKNLLLLALLIMRPSLLSKSMNLLLFFQE